MGYDTIRYDVEGGVATITMNRPEVANAQNTALIDALDAAFDDRRLRQRLAQAYVEVRLFQLHNWRTLSQAAKGQEPGRQGSILKLYWSEMSKRLHDTAMAVIGPASPLWRSAQGNPGDGRWQRSWLYYQGSSIWAGTNEIQRNVVGERTLGLPREPR